MSPEQTFFQALASGQIPFGAGLLALMALVLWRGQSSLAELTKAVQAVPAALVAHRVETTTALVEVKTHTTAEADRVIAVIEDRRLSEMGETVAAVSRAVSDPDLGSSPRRQPTGSRAAIR